MRVTVDIPDQRITDLITCALEGGSNYWYQIDLDKTNRMGQTYLVEVPMAGGCLDIIAFGDGDERFEHKGCTRWPLDRKACVRGLRTMQQSYPTHYANFIAENEDAETGDVFLQCCLFGEVIFG